MEGVMSTLGSAAMTALGSAVLAELLLAWGVDDDIRTLQSRAETIKAVLRDAETRAINDEALRKWLRDLKDVAFDAEDALDELQIEAALGEGKKEKASHFSFMLKTFLQHESLCLRFDNLLVLERTSSTQLLMYCLHECNKNPRSEFCSFHGSTYIWLRKHCFYYSLYIKGVVEVNACLEEESSFMAACHSTTLLQRGNK